MRKGEMTLPERIPTIFVVEMPTSIPITVFMPAKVVQTEDNSKDFEKKPQYVFVSS
jgi:hypothetical protein